MAWGACQVDALFAIFDADGSGDISFRELHRMLRKAVPVTPPARRRVVPTHPVDVEALRTETRNQLLTMQLQSEMHKNTTQVVNDLLAMTPVATPPALATAGLVAPPDLLPNLTAPLQGEGGDDEMEPRGDWS